MTSSSRVDRPRAVVAQQPLSSQFDAYATADDVVAGLDLTGTTAIVTGGHSGIGIPAVRALLSAGAHVTVPARDPAKARLRLTGLDVEIRHLDLAEPRSVEAFADAVLAKGRPVHRIIAGAGIMGVPLARDRRGIESHVATNHLGHHQLITSLWPALRAAGGARVVMVSAWAHRLSPVVFDDLSFERRPYDPFAAYGQSKTANILFALELDRRGAEDGIAGFSVHPGSIVGTDLSGWTTSGALRARGLVDEAGEPVIDPPSGRKTASQGAATGLWAATAAELQGHGGVYCENSNISPLVATPPPGSLDDVSATPVGVMAHAVDPDAATRLWSMSERLLGRG